MCPRCRPTAAWATCVPWAICLGFLQTWIHQDFLTQGAQANGPRYTRWSTLHQERPKKPKVHNVPKLLMWTPAQNLLQLGLLVYLGPFVWAICLGFFANSLHQNFPTQGAQAIPEIHHCPFAEMDNAEIVGMSTLINTESIQIPNSLPSTLIELLGTYLNTSIWKNAHISTP